MQVILRDDDISFFTRVDMLEAIYGKLWRRGVPVCLSVIPDHRTGVIPHDYIRTQQNNPFNLNAPPEFRHTNESHTMDRNGELCAFLDGLVGKGLVEIAIHGFWHGDEYAVEDRATVEANLLESRKILETCFPNSAFKTVVPPFEILSRTARDAMLAAGLDISTTYESFHVKTRLDRLLHLPNRLRRKFVSPIPAETIERKNGSTIFFGIDVFGQGASPEDSLSDAVRKFEECLAEDKTFICVNHYWFFFDDWKEPREGILEAWDEFVSHMLSKADVEWTTFERFSRERKNGE